MAKIISKTLNNNKILEEKTLSKTEKNKKKFSQMTLDRKALSKAVLAAAHRAGKQFGEDGLISYLEAQALATPSPFIALLAKAICEVEEEQTSSITKIEIVAVDQATSMTTK